MDACPKEEDVGRSRCHRPPRARAWGLLGAPGAALALAAASVLPSCALNDLGLVRVRHLENASARVVRLDAWGIHVTTGAEDGGVTLGRSRRTYVFAREEGARASVPLDVLTPAGQASRRLRTVACGPCPGLTQLGTPLAAMTRTAGVRLDANARRVGFSVGARSQATLRLPADASSVLFIAYDSRHDERSELYVGKEVQR